MGIILTMLSSVHEIQKRKKVSVVRTSLLCKRALSQVKVPVLAYNRLQTLILPQICLDLISNVWIEISPHRTFFSITCFTWIFHNKVKYVLLLSLQHEFKWAEFEASLSRF